MPEQIEAQDEQNTTSQADALLDLNDDTPLTPVCDLSGDKICESCQ